MTTKKKSVAKKNNKEDDLKKWENYSYWANLAEKKRDEITNKMCERLGMNFMASKITTRKLEGYLNGEDFFMEEKTPLGTITVAVYDGFSACRRKDGGFIYRTCLTVISADRLTHTTDTNYHFEGYDTVMCEAVETICDKLGELMRGAFYKLQHGE